MSDVIYIDAKGDKQAVDLSVSMYADAADKNMSLKQFMAVKYPTNAEKHGSAYEQVLDQAGVYVRDNKEFGIRASTVGDVVNPKNAAAITREGIPASRLLFPAIMLDVIEDKMMRDYTTNPAGLTGLLAIDDAIQGERFERPVLNFSRPEAARSGTIAQLALPNAMLSITSSDKAMRIPTWGIGLEISEQAQKSTTLDLVGLALARQAQVEANERANAYILSLLQGDVDHGMAALSTIAGKVVKASVYDATIVAAGTLTKKAWMKWLTANSTYRTITHVVTDFDTAVVLDNLLNGTNSSTFGPTATITSKVSVMNTSWPSNVQIFVTNDTNWPANTIMGLDKSAAVHRISSTTAQYSAIEQFAMKRSTMLRFDKGDMVYRLFDEAFEVLTLTL